MALPLKKTPTDITVLLQRFQAGDEAAFEALIPLVYEQLKKIASNQMRAQAPYHTLCSTALVHEAFLKLKEAGTLSVIDRTHFYAIAARTMRWLLTDYARTKRRDKRGGDAPVRVVFDENRHSLDNGVEPSALEEALKKLEKQDVRLCRVVELRYLVGLTIEETAQALSISPMTVKREWITARAWLARELEIQLPD